MMLFIRSAMDLLTFVLLFVLAISPVGSGFPFSASQARKEVKVGANSTTMLAYQRLMPRQCEWDPAQLDFVCDR